MKGILFVEANENGLVTKAALRCTGVERLLLLDELRKALSYTKEQFVRDAHMIAAIDFEAFDEEPKETEETED